MKLFGPHHGSAAVTDIFKGRLAKILAQDLSEFCHSKDYAATCMLQMV